MSCWHPRQDIEPWHVQRAQRAETANALASGSRSRQQPPVHDEDGNDSQMALTLQSKGAAFCFEILPIVHMLPHLDRSKPTRQMVGMTVKHCFYYNAELMPPFTAWHDFYELHHSEQVLPSCLRKQKGARLRAKLQHLG